MRFAHLAAAVLIAATAASPATGQSAAPAQPTPAAASLGVFEQMLGEWEGDAWMLRGPGARHEVRQWERVERHAGGTVIAVKGVGTEHPAGGPPRTVHDAFAVLHLDRDGATPRMRAFVTGGRWLDVELTVHANGYDWAMTDPRAGQIRYEMRLDEQGRWVERGFMSRDEGNTWTQFMEMTLTRKTGAP